MENLFVGIIVNVFLLLSIALFIYKANKQRVYNRLLRSYKGNKNLRIVNKTKSKKWGSWLTACCSVALVFNAFNFDNMKTGLYAATGKENTLASNGVSSNAVSSLTSVEESQDALSPSICEYNSSTNQYIDKDGCTIPSSSETSSN